MLEVVPQVPALDVVVVGVERCENDPFDLHRAVLVSAETGAKLFGHRVCRQESPLFGYEPLNARG